MQRAELRLELLQLTYTHGRDVAEAVGRAKSLEAYVLGEELDEVPKVESPVVAKPAPMGRPRKTPPGNVDFLK